MATLPDKLGISTRGVL